MLWILKYFSINNKYTSSLVACAISCGKSAFRTFLSIVLISSLLRVCFCTSRYVSIRSQNQIWLSCLVTFITQVWLKLLSWNFVQVSSKYIPTPPGNIINIHLTMSFNRLVSYSHFFFWTPGIYSIDIRG